MKTNQIPDNQPDQAAEPEVITTEIVQETGNVDNAMVVAQASDADKEVVKALSLSMHVHNPDM